jgi:hypothetical protein
LGTLERAKLTKRLGSGDAVPMELRNCVATESLDGREDPIQDRAFALRLVAHASQSNGDQANEPCSAREILKSDRHLRHAGNNFSRTDDVQ